MERARKIQLRLGGSASLLTPSPAKPKGMWRKTHEHLLSQCAAHEATMTRLLMERLEKQRSSKKEKNSNADIVADLAGVAPTKPTKTRERPAHRS
jgi:hypothetical protein